MQHHYIEPGGGRWPVSYKTGCKLKFSLAIDELVTCLLLNRIATSQVGDSSTLRTPPPPPLNFSVFWSWGLAWLCPGLARPCPVLAMPLPTWNLAEISLLKVGRVNSATCKQQNINITLNSKIAVMVTKWEHLVSKNLDFTVGPVHWLSWFSVNVFISIRDKVKGNAFYPFLGGELRAKTVDTKHNLSRCEKANWHTCSTSQMMLFIHVYVQEAEYTTQVPRVYT